MSYVSSLHDYKKQSRHHSIPCKLQLNIFHRRGGRGGRGWRGWRGGRSAYNHRSCGKQPWMVKGQSACAPPIDCNAALKRQLLVVTHLQQLATAHGLIICTAERPLPAHNSAKHISTARNFNAACPTSLPAFGRLWAGAGIPAPGLAGLGAGSGESPG